jgi:hypothetical protein
MKARLSIGSAVGALGVLVAVACSSSTPTPPDSDVSTFCSDWAKAYCQLATSCEFDPAACTTFQTGQCTSFASTAAASGTRQYSQPNGKACIDALNSAYGGNPTEISAAQLTSLNDECNRAFTGNVASDKSCTSDYDCANNLVCEPILGGGGNVCAAVNQKNLGDICGDPGDECQGDSYCAPVAGAAPACIATPTTNSACSAAIPCGSTDHCIVAAGSTSTTCQIRATLGQTCATSDDCAASAAYCDTYPPAACVTGLTFGRGSIDCRGISGTDEPGTPVTDDDAGTPSVTDSGSDAPSSD